MKSMLMWCAVVTVVSAIQQETYEVPLERVHAVMNKFGKPCAEKFNVDIEVLMPKLADGSLPRDNDAINNFLYCFCLGAGYIEEDGHINVDGLAGILPADHPRKEEMKESLRKCNEITKENKIQTVIAMNDCLPNTAPVRYIVAL